MKLRKTNLDELQERKLLEIESRGFWLAFWGILLALIVETVVMTKDLRAIIGEWVLFMGLALYNRVLRDEEALFYAGASGFVVKRRIATSEFALLAMTGGHLIRPLRGHLPFPREGGGAKRVSQ